MERLGLIYLQEEFNEQATKLLTKAVHIEPGRWRSHNGLGVLADRRGEHTVALVHYGEALVWERKRDGGFPDAAELKRRVRDRVWPERELGHSDKNG